jgi:tetratricopeptide (TPR) repeat protein
MLSNNSAWANEQKPKGTACSFTEAMTFLDKYSGEQDMLKKAAGCVETMVAEDPLTYLVKGRILVKTSFQSRDHYDEKLLADATNYYEKAITLAPENYEVNYYAALFFGTVLKNEAKSQKYLEKISKSSLNSERTLYLKMTLLPDGKPEKEDLAVHFLESPVFIQKHDALTILKHIYWKSDHKTVEKMYAEMFKNGEKHNVNMAWDYNDYAGFLIYQKREFDKAAEMMDKSRSLMTFGLQHQNDGEIAYRRGYQYVWNTNPRDYAKAISLFNECIQHNSRHKYVYYNLAIACYYHGMATKNKELIYEAKEYMIKAKEINPSYGDFEKKLTMINNTISQIEEPSFKRKI